jgi:ribosome-binding factor A
LRGRLDLRLVPELRFVQDDTMEEADRVLRIMNSLESKKERQRE